MQNDSFEMPTSAVYIFAPAGTVTGGVELLHQLCDILNANRKEAYIVYYGTKEHTIPSDYRKYNLKIIESDKIPDSEETVIVVPETRLCILNEYKKSKAIVWWMSVDNYFAALQANCVVSFAYHLRYGMFFAYNSAIKMLVRKILRKRLYPSYSLSKLKKNKNIVCNAYQSEYADSFLKKHGITNTKPLSDYINDEYAFYQELLSKKENIIIYNPKKGLRFTKRLIAAAPDLHWIPIQNMSRLEVKEMMCRAKLYIDFGHFPGKDRMPREAAMCGCCIITGKLGAAGFTQDLPIDEKFYKFNQRKQDIPLIIQRIRFVLENYETEIEQFADYRTVIAGEKSAFIRNVLEIMYSEYLMGGGVCRVISSRSFPAKLCA